MSLFGGLSAAVVSAADGPQLAIYATNADGTNLKKVAQAPGKRWHAAPVWSSDGKFVAFHAHTMDASTPDSHIFVVKEDGSDLKDLGPGAFPAWSPDSKQLLFSIDDQNPEKAQAGVWVMNADGKGRQWLFAGACSPSYSPDGSRILYVSSHEGNQSIYVYDIISGMPQKILQEPYQKRPGSARWSPDGKRVAFVDERGGKLELYLIDAAGSEKGQTMRQRGLLGGPVAWGNGKLVFWTRDKAMTDSQRLSVLSPDGEEAPTILPNQDAGTLNFDPALSADGQRLLFVSDREK
jgi:Tol biopolymer transport system component